MPILRCAACCGTRWKGGLIHAGKRRDGDDLRLLRSGRQNRLAERAVASIYIVRRHCVGLGPEHGRHVCRCSQMAEGHADVPVFQTFYQTYKKEFIKTNGLGLILAAIGWMLFVNHQFFQGRADLFSIMVSYSTWLAGVLYIMVLMYIFPLYVHFEMPFVRYFSQAVLIGMLRPLTTIAMAASGAAVVYVLMTVPGLIPFYGISLFALVWMFLAHRCFLGLGNAASAKKDKQAKSTDIQMLNIKSVIFRYLPIARKYN